MRTVVGVLVYTVIQRQVRLYLRDHDQQVPGNKGLTATPTAAAVFALFTPVMLVLTFRTLFWSSEAILTAPPKESNGQAMPSAYQSTELFVFLDPLSSSQLPA